jgi:hypothetical protein
MSDRTPRATTQPGDGRRARAAARATLGTPTRSPGGSERRDLSSAVTVFVTTVGADTFDACLERLHAQDCEFRLEVIRDVTPASAAFQLMLDRCQTPMYVQVDEDMLLFPHAVRTLHDALAAARRDVVSVIGRLVDVHLGRPIEGVKIFRLAPSVAFPWRDSPSVQQRWARMTAAGWRIKRLPASGRWEVPPLGLHGTAWTARSIWGRYRTMQRMLRRFPDDMEWFEVYAARFMERYVAEPTRLSFFALVGLVSGAIGPLGDDAGEHDHAELMRAHQFDAAWALWSSIAPEDAQTGGPDAPIT